MPSMISRTHRGFHRIGIVLAASVLTLSLWLGGQEAWEHQTFRTPSPTIRLTMADGTTRDIQAPDIEAALHEAGYGPERLASGEVRAVKLVPVDYDPWASGTEFPRAPSYTMALLLFALAVGLYAAARTVGWVLDGFMGSDRP